MGHRQDEALFTTYQLALPRAWFRKETQARLPDPLLLRVELLRGPTVLRLLGMPEKPDDPTLDFAGRLTATGGASEGKGSLRWPAHATEAAEVSQAQDDSFQLQRSGLRGVLSLEKNRLAIVHEELLWFGLGRLLKRGLTREQTFTLVREASTPGLISGLLSLTEEREEPLKLRDETVQARRFRYQTKELGYPRERARGKLWLGPQGELLQSELLPTQSATAALALEKNNPVFTLTCTDGIQRRAEQGSQGWSVTHSDKGLEADLDFDRRLLRLTSRRSGSALSATWDGMALRYAYPSVLPTSLSVPSNGTALFLASLLLPEPLPRLVSGETRPILLFPLVTGEALALEGELTRLPDTPKKLKSYQLTLEGDITTKLESDTRGLVRLTSNGALAITRKQ